jgi:hypothetical protein
VHVALRHRQVLVPREFLNRSRRCAPHGQVAAKRVAQQVNAMAVHPRSSCSGFDSTLHHLPRQRGSIVLNQHPRTPQVPMFGQSGQPSRERKMALSPALRNRHLPIPI